MNAIGGFTWFFLLVFFFMIIIPLLLRALRRRKILLISDLPIGSTETTTTTTGLKTTSFFFIIINRQFDIKHTDNFRSKTFAFFFPSSGRRCWSRDAIEEGATHSVCYFHCQCCNGVFFFFFLRTASRRPCSLFQSVFYILPLYLYLIIWLKREKKKTFTGLLVKLHSSWCGVALGFIWGALIRSGGWWFRGRPHLFCTFSAVVFNFSTIFTTF